MCVRSRLVSMSIVAIGLLMGFVSTALATPGEVVISQVYALGGNAASTWRNDYVELFNRSGAPVNLAGWSLQATQLNNGTTWVKGDLPSVTLSPGQFFLVQFGSSGSNGLALSPSPNATMTLNISSNSKVALMRTTTQIAAGTACPTGDPSLADFVGMGTANCFEGTATAPTNPGATGATYRLNLIDGCVDSDNNAADFATGAAVPRSTASPFASCAPTGACCESGVCEIRTEAACAAPSMYQGNASVCAPNLCPIFGACCSANGSACSVQSQTACLGVGGAFLGADFPCPELPCVVGACCSNDGLTCVFSTEATCNDQYQGHDTTCPPGPCPFGACCDSNHSACFATTAAACVNYWSGTFTSVGFPCTPEPCTAACCEGAAHNCTVQTILDCSFVVGGTSLALFTTCGPTNPCLPAPNGVCCSNQFGCHLYTQSFCLLGAGNVWTGPGGTCAPNPCGPTGACCPLSGSTCTFGTQGACADMGGTSFQGAGSSCTPNPCGPRGACCTSTVCLTNTTQQCAAQSGTYFGPSFGCEANPCGTTFGACCSASSVCTVSTAAACSSASSTFQGLTTSCSGSPCDAAITGACCTDFPPPPACAIRTQQNCVVIAQGSYRGNGSSCTPNLCVEILGACCYGPSGESCQRVLASICTTNLSGVYRGDNTSCDPNLCPISCCRADGTCLVTNAGDCATQGGSVSAIGACGVGACVGSCCTGAVDCQAVNSSAECSTLSGAYTPGVACSTNPCVGACCRQAIGGDCTATSPFNCQLMGGAYEGNNTSCQMHTCDGPCCDLGTGVCALDNRPHCQSMGHTWHGFSLALASCTPIPCPTGACCAPTGSICTITAIAACSPGTFLGGPCTPNPCPGTCCALTGGGCTITPISGCSGTFFGAPLPCSPNPCGGACCLLSAPYGCIIASATGCALQGGAFIGTATCGTTTCNGACCSASGCASGPPSACTASGSTFRGVGVGCTPDPCPGACCLRDPAECEISTASACVLQSGIFAGPGTSCQPTTCIGACCIGDVGPSGYGHICVEFRLAFCYGNSGQFRGLGTTCQSPPGSANYVFCCVANFNNVGGVSVSDIFAFLSAWFAQTGQIGPGHTADVNHDNAVNVADIFAFLGTWFASCA